MDNSHPVIDTSTLYIDSYLELENFYFYIDQPVKTGSNWPRTCSCSDKLQKRLCSLKYKNYKFIKTSCERSFTIFCK